MNQFSGHAVIPSLFRDMKGGWPYGQHLASKLKCPFADKHRFNSMLDTAYLLAFAVSFLFGALGYVM